MTFKLRRGFHDEIIDEIRKIIEESCKMITECPLSLSKLRVLCKINIFGDDDLLGIIFARYIGLKKYIVVFYEMSENIIVKSGEIKEEDYDRIITLLSMI